MLILGVFSNKNEFEIFLIKNNPIFVPVTTLVIAVVNNCSLIIEIELFPVNRATQMGRPFAFSKLLTRFFLLFSL